MDVMLAYFLNEFRKNIRNAIRKHAKESSKDKYQLGIRIYFNPDAGENSEGDIAYDFVEGRKGETQIEFDKIRDIRFDQDILDVPEDGYDLMNQEALLKPKLHEALDKYTKEFACEKTDVSVIIYLAADNNDVPVFVIYIKGKYRRVLDLEKEFGEE